MMIKSFLIIRFSEHHFKATLRIYHTSRSFLLMLSARQFSAKLHNACGHDMKRHVTGIYKDSQRRHTGNKITNYLRPYLCSVEHHRKNLCASVSLFMTVYVLCVFAEKISLAFFMAKFLFNFMLSIFIIFAGFVDVQPPTRT